MSKIRHKKIILTSIIFAAVSCAETVVLNDEGENSRVGISLTVEEAKAFFEAEYESLKVVKNGDPNKYVGWISPGDFTPIWSMAKESVKVSTASVDVPIIPTFRYMAVCSEYSNGKVSAYSVDVYQKLVIVKNSYEHGEESRMGLSVLTLIPDKLYAARYKGRVAEQFVNAGDKGLYSGLAVYYSHGIPIRLNKYVDGQKIVGLAIYGKGDKDIQYKFKKILTELDAFEILRSKQIQTRSGEDGWDWDFGNTDDYYDLGDGLYMDEDGDYYYDQDGDGEIDSMYLYPSESEVPEDPEPSEEDTDDWPHSNDSNYDDELTYDGEETDNYNDYNDYDGEDGWFEDSNDENASNLPATLSAYYGKVTYYDERVADFKRRHPGCVAPAYYLNYGRKYCDAFCNQTRNNLSDAGKEWVDKTMVALQVKLTEILRDNPGIELSPVLLEQKAFESHVSAYIESGILSLPMSDKIEILLTVEYEDLVLKEEGREQVAKVIFNQLQYYLTHPSAAGADAWYFMTNYSNIMARLETYIQNNMTKTSSNQVQEVFDLLFGQLIEYYEENVPGFSIPETY